MIEWPDGVPHTPILGTWRCNPRDDLARSSFDQGPQLSRSQFTSVIYEASYTIQMDRVQYELFKEFYHVTLVNGSKWFVSRVYQSQCLAYEMHLTAVYKQERNSTRKCNVMLEVEIRDFDVPISPALIDALDAWGEDDLIDIFDGLHHLVHVSYPAAVL